MRKRARAVAAAWPALRYSLGDRFAEVFERFAHDTPPPARGEGWADGFAFASSLDRRSLTDGARAELLLARGLLMLRHGMPMGRRGPFLGAALLRSPNRFLVVVRVPGIGRRHGAIQLAALSPSARASR